MEPSLPLDRYVTLGGLRFHYREFARPGAATLLLLHGFGEQAQCWDDIALGLQDQFRVLVPDQRGHGDSQWAADYRPSRWVADVGALVEALVGERVILVGHSLGAVHAWSYAAAFPERVRRLVIIDIGPPGTTPAPHTPSSLVGWLRYGYDALRYRLLRGGRHRLRAALSGRRPHHDPRLRATPRQPEQEWERLSAVTCPTLLVRAANSDVLSREGAVRMVKRMRDCRLVELPHCGHVVRRDNPTALLTAVRQFLLAPRDGDGPNW